MSKKIRKHKKDGNRLARDRRLADIFTQNIGVVNLPGDNCEVVDIETLKVKRNISAQQSFDITGHQHNWSILLCVFGRTELGEEYFKAEEVTSKRLCYQADICESMNAQHRKLYNEFNRNHFVSLGWVACPHDREFDLDKMFTLFKTLGAFEYITKLEDAK